MRIFSYISVPSCLALTLLLSSVQAYIPASPTNDTNTANATSVSEVLNDTDTSRLHLQWYSNGSYWENVSYQLVGSGSDGVSVGALVHFSESNVSIHTPPTSTPWIALVACDFNATDASQELDIFTLAHDKGAVSALLYSLYSQACVINPEYADPTTFNQVMDIFSTPSLTSSHLIDYQFGQFGPMNESIYGSYDSQELNDSAKIINETIASNNPIAPGYLFATLIAFNATDLDNTSSSGNTAGTSSSSGNNDSSNTGTAMIILYAITGCVSALFCVVIISGAVRAIRHPERYGPRTGNNHDGRFMGQSRARGLTRAILDTFPVVKFGSTEEQVNTEEHNPNKEVESLPDGDATVKPRSTVLEMTEWEVVDETAGSIHESQRPTSVHFQASDEQRADAQHRRSRADTQPSASGSKTRTADMGAESSAKHGISRPPVRTPTDREDVVPAAIGRETCPICIVDFEEGDDLRLLPCEGKHRFHQQCVDPWLLELSSSCPICRHDFLALENMLSGEADNGDHRYRRASGSAQINRFSRYLRFARGRRNAEEVYDSAEPDSSFVPEVPV